MSVKAPLLWGKHLCDVEPEVDGGQDPESSAALVRASRGPAGRAQACLPPRTGGGARETVPPAPPLREPQGAPVYLRVSDTRDKGGREGGAFWGKLHGGKRLTGRSRPPAPPAPLPRFPAPLALLGFYPSLGGNGRSWAVGHPGKLLSPSPFVTLWTGPRRLCGVARQRDRGPRRRQRCGAEESQDLDSGRETGTAGCSLPQCRETASHSPRLLPQPVTVRPAIFQTLFPPPIRIEQYIPLLTGSNGSGS
ncbi:unnamed protein product [Nyctereutes procyonoides]|uniref:(raccoon dog) hypothetical protein n=1 Tax=Nyctereutes procyonoides TaxID=34880 RepID=A0A811ZE45_NYCPR|nr:unnamed protein product [Nyctereutes procyonoides]